MQKTESDIEFWIDIKLMSWGSGYALCPNKSASTNGRMVQRDRIYNPVARTFNFKKQY